MYFSASVPSPSSQARAPGRSPTPAESERPRGPFTCDCGRRSPTRVCARCRRLDGSGRLESRAIHEMRMVGAPVSLAYLEDQLGSPRESLQRLMQRMLADGRVRRFASYELTTVTGWAASPTDSTRRKSVDMAYEQWMYALV